MASLQCIHIIDITSPMLAATNFDELLEQDGITLSAAGEAVVANEMRKLEAHEAA